MPNPPVPEWGCQLIDKLRREGWTRAHIAHVIGYSADTVKKLVRSHREHREPRVPRQGRGKKRWVFAGLGGIRALAELEVLKERLEDDELVLDVLALFVESGAYSPAYRTLCNALQKSPGYTVKRVRAAPALPPSPPSGAVTSGVARS